MKAVIFSMIWGVFSVVFLFAFVSEASEIGIGRLQHGGTGCPAGSVVTDTNENDEIEIVFDQFLAQSGGSKKIDRKSCAVSIPVVGRAGFQYALALYGEGYVDVDRGARATFNQEVFFAGSKGPINTKNFVGPKSQVFDTLGGEELQWTPCGQSANLRANLSLLTRGEGSAQLDHLFIKVLQIRSCN